MWARARVRARGRHGEAKSEAESGEDLFLVPCLLRNLALRGTSGAGVDDADSGAREEDLFKALGDEAGDWWAGGLRGTPARRVLCCAGDFGG